MRVSKPLRLSQEGQYSLKSISKFLAHRVQAAGDSLPTTTQLVRKRLKYAVKWQQLKASMAGNDLTFSHSDVFMWARKKWPGQFDDIATRVEMSGSCSIRLAASATGLALPGELQECHKLILSLTEEASLLRRELAAAVSEIEILKPQAEQNEKNRETWRRNGNMPKGV